MYQENAWKKYSGESLDKLMKFNEDYKKYISESKTERLCVKNAIAICEANGFKELSTFKTLKPGDKVYATNKGKNIAAFVIGDDSIQNV